MDGSVTRVAGAIAMLNKHKKHQGDERHRGYEPEQRQRIQNK